MKILDGVHIVGSGDAGFSLSGPMDANCYAIDTGDGVWLFDVGFDSADQIVANIARDGLDPTGIVAIFLTHHHADHAGATAEFARRFPSATIAVSAEVADGVRQGDESVNGLAWAREVGFYPDTFRLQPTRIDIALTPGMDMTCGDWHLTAVATPGHCLGHFSFVVRGPDTSVLVSGDQVFCDGRILLQNLPDVSIAQVADSMGELLSVDFEALLPGHGRFAVARGRRHVELAKTSFDMIGVPPNMF